MSGASQTASQRPRVDVLGIHSGALGDVILFAQLLEALRPPGGTVGLVAGASKAGLVKALGVVDRIWSFDSLAMHEAFMDTSDALAGAWPRCGRLVSCFATGDGDAEDALADACGASRRAFLPTRPRPTDSRHIVDVWAETLRLETISPPFWPPPAALVDEAAKMLGSVGVDSSGEFALLHIGAGSPAKRWPLSAFESLADRLAWPCVFVAGPVECERAAADVRAVSSRRKCLVNPSLTSLAGAASLARVFVGCDSGPTHLAAAVGAPTMALFGPTDPVRFAPRGRCVEVLGNEPLAQLSVDRVAQGALSAGQSL